MLEDKPTDSQLFVDMMSHPGYKLLMDEIIGKVITDAEKLIWDSHSPQERSARVEMVTAWKALMGKVDAKIKNTIATAQQQTAKGKKHVQDTQRRG